MGAARVLTILKDGQILKSQPLDGEAVLGRAEGCVIRIDDRAISRQHAVFKPTADGVRIEKKSEFASLAVNGAECTSALVKEGDVIEIGPYLLKISAGAASGPRASQPTTFMQEPVPDAAFTGAPEIPLEIAPSSTISLEAPSADSAPVQLASDAQEPASPAVPEFSLDAAAPEASAPVDLGEIHVDEEAKTKLAPAAKISAKLVVQTGTANVTELEIQKDEISIGRGKDCDLALDDKKASRRHALIRRAGMSFSIKDLDSANGTYVNGSKVQEQPLSGDDVIRIGNAEMRFVALSADYVKNEQNFMPVQEEPEIDADAGGGGGNYYQPSPSQSSGAADPFAQPEAMRVPSSEASLGVSGLAGIGGVAAKKQSLFQKYRSLPPRRKAIWTAVIIAALYFAFFDDQMPRTHPRPKTAAAAHGPATFDSLTSEQKKFVESQHALAFDYYSNHEYDKAIFEIDKIFALIPDYKDSREIERYAKEGKRKLEALQEEKRKQDEEARLKVKVAELVSDAKSLMDQKKYDETGDLFSQILSLEPDNQQVADWRKQVDAYEDQKRIEDEQKEVQRQINVRAWDLYKEGLALKEQKKYSEAIESFRRVAEIGATDKRAEREADARIEDIHKLIADLRDPVLSDAKQAEDAQDYAKAYALYEKATEIDPSDSAGYAGMDRVRGVLHERAKALYIDAVLAESYTDFDTAKKKYQECLQVAPKDDPYHDRAERKLASFFSAAPSAAAGDGTGADGAPQ